MAGDGFAGEFEFGVVPAGEGDGCESGLCAGGACWDGAGLSWPAGAGEVEGEAAVASDCWTAGRTADPRTQRGEHPKLKE